MFFPDCEKGCNDDEGDDLTKVQLLLTNWPQQGDLSLSLSLRSLFTYFRMREREGGRESGDKDRELKSGRKKERK